MILKKIWEDDNLIEIELTCISSVVTTRSRIYVCDDLIDELADQINHFLEGEKKEIVWQNEKKGNQSPPCIILHFLNKDARGHILVEVFLEIDDGGDFAKHNCCFYINTEHGLLMNFVNKLERLKSKSKMCEIQLNDY
jgi:hypothetical protein